MIRKDAHNLVGNQGGFSLVELMVAALIFAIIVTSASVMFVAGQDSWGLVDTKIALQDQVRKVLQRLSLELSESGEDENSVHQVTIFNNTGVGGTDVLRFAVPICPCGVLPMDATGDVQFWGAPVVWGQSGCNDNYTVVAGQVEMCDVSVPVTVDVNENLVKARLAEGDYLGTCAACTPAAYTNYYVEYLLDNNNNLIRRVLNNGLGVIGSNVFADGVADFQVSLNGGQTIVSLNLALTDTTTKNRQVTRNGSMNVILRNMN